MKIETIILLLCAIIGASLVYAADWQREQDAKISDLKVITMEQNNALRMQIQINQQYIEERKRRDNERRKANK